MWHLIYWNIHQLQYKLQCMLPFQKRLLLSFRDVTKTYFHFEYNQK